MRKNAARVKKGPVSDRIRLWKEKTAGDPAERRDAMRNSMTAAAGARTELAGKCGKNFRNGKISDVLLENSELTFAEFDCAELTDVCFYGVDFEQAKFRFAKLRDVTFIRCNLKNADFGFAGMRGVKFIGCRLEGSSYDCAFGDAAFTDCSVKGAGFHHSGLELTVARGGANPDFR